MWARSMKAKKLLQMTSDREQGFVYIRVIVISYPRVPNVQIFGMSVFEDGSKLLVDHGPPSVIIEPWQN